MKKNCVFFFSVLVAVALFDVMAEFAWAGFGIGTLYGRVVNDYTGEGIGGAKLTFRSSNNPVVFVTFPDGGFVADLLSGNGYVLEVNKEWYHGKMFHNINVISDGYTDLGKIRLRPLFEFRIDQITSASGESFLEGTPKSTRYTLHGSKLNIINRLVPVGRCFQFRLLDPEPESGGRTRNITVIYDGRSCSSAESGFILEYRQDLSLSEIPTSGHYDDMLMMSHHEVPIGRVVSITKPGSLEKLERSTPPLHKNGTARELEKMSPMTDKK